VIYFFLLLCCLCQEQNVRPVVAPVHPLHYHFVGNAEFAGLDIDAHIHVGIDTWIEIMETVGNCERVTLRNVDINCFRTVCAINS